MKDLRNLQERKKFLTKQFDLTQSVSNIFFFFFFFNSVVHPVQGPGATRG